MKLSELLFESYSAYLLSKKSRSLILNKFPPKFSKVDAHHITVKFGLSKTDRIPHTAKLQVVGYSCDASLESVVVSVNGKTNRPDGSTYHITLSYEPGRKPVESNKLLRNGWTDVSPFDIEATPKILN
jgi:hypothetical protein